MIDPLLCSIGFEDVSIALKGESREVIAGWIPGSGVENYISSAKICARKPHTYKEIEAVHFGSNINALPPVSPTPMPKG